MKFFTSEMPGAPTMNGVAGAMISLLDACLKDGFGLKSVTSVTVAGGIATVTFGSGLAFTPGSSVVLAGVTDKTALNGDQKVLTSSATQVTFATGATDGTAAGTITIKVSPLGWLKPFSGTNLAVYRASAPEATGCCLRLDDAGATTCRVVGYESMTDVATGLGRFPTEGQFAGGFYWPKSSVADAAARSWAVFGDGQFFAVYVMPSTNANFGGSLHGFGDFISLKSGDAYGCVLFGSTASTVGSTGAANPADLGFSGAISDTAAHGYAPRAATGMGGSQAVLKHSAYLTTAQSGTANNGTAPFPNVADNGLLLSRVDLRSAGGFRGRLPGIYHTPQYALDAFTTFNRVDGTGEFAGKTLMVLRCGTTGNTVVGPTFVDITGPWR